MIISRSVLLKIRNVSKKLQKKSEHKFCVQKRVPEIVPFMR